MFMASFLESAMAGMDASFPLSESDDTDDEILRSQFFGKRRSNQEPPAKSGGSPMDDEKKTLPVNIQVGDRVKVYNKHTGVRTVTVMRLMRGVVSDIVCRWSSLLGQCITPAASSWAWS